MSKQIKGITLYTVEELTKILNISALTIRSYLKVENSEDIRLQDIGTFLAAI